MRSYVVVVLIILGMMGTYVALMPHSSMTEINAGLTGSGPG